MVAVTRWGLWFGPKRFDIPVIVQGLKNILKNHPTWTLQWANVSISTFLRLRLNSSLQLPQQSLLNSSCTKCPLRAFCVLHSCMSRWLYLQSTATKRQDCMPWTILKRIRQKEKRQACFLSVKKKQLLRATVIVALQATTYRYSKISLFCRVTDNSVHIKGIEPFVWSPLNSGDKRRVRYERSPKEED